MWFDEARVYFLFASFSGLALAAGDDSQFVYLKSVRCNHNPRLLENVTCFAKSYSRTISKATVYAHAIIPQSSIMVSSLLSHSIVNLIFFNRKHYFEMYYKYGTIYRQVLHTPSKIDFCYYMNNLDSARNDLLFKHLIDILDNVSTGFVRPCPWKVNLFFSFFWIIDNNWNILKDINLTNITISTGKFSSIWPTGDYRCVLSFTTGTGELFINMTFIGSFRTPLKESFGWRYFDLSC